MVKLGIVSLLSFSVVSCVTNDASQINAPKSTQDRLGTAVVSPLSDFNIVQTGIPPVLTDAVKNPYVMAPVNTCKGLAEQVQLLDAALGPDLDAIVAHEKTDMEKGGDFAQDEAIGGVQRTIEGVIPFRSWVRKISGAEQRSNELKTAVAAGIVRRAFLKGMGQERGCEAPAAPIKHPPPDAVPLPLCDSTKAGEPGSPAAAGKCAMLTPTTPNDGVKPPNPTQPASETQTPGPQ